MKKLAILALVLFLGFVALNLVMLSKFNFTLFDIIGNREFSQSYVDEKNGTYDRAFPEMIKGSWEPSASHLAVMLTRDLDQLRELGLTTVSVVPSYVIHDDLTYSIMGDGEAMLVSNIIRAKEAGFSVFLAPDLIMGNMQIGSRMNITREQYLGISKEIALKWAQVAEDFGVEYFCPQNEINVIITVNFAGNDSEAAGITTDWHNSVIPEIKEIFSGKTMVKLSQGIEENSTFEGYDLIGIDFNHQGKGLEEYRRDVRDRYGKIARVAEDSDADWLVAEIWMPYTASPWNPSTVNEEGVSLDELQDEYYGIAIEEYEDFVGLAPVGFMFHTWIMPGTDIRNRDAEGVVSAFFNE